MHIEFRNNEESYLRWITNNPDGYVLNTRRKPDPDYMILHKASCHTICITTNNQNNLGGFTQKAYIKICANSVEHLKPWVKTHGRHDGSFSKKCGICKP